MGCDLEGRGAPARVSSSLSWPVRACNSAREGRAAGGRHLCDPLEKVKLGSRGGWQGLGKDGEQGAQGIFRAVSRLRGAVMGDTCAQTRTSLSEPRPGCGRWVVTNVSAGSPAVTNRPRGWGVLVVRGAVHK